MGSDVVRRRAPFEFPDQARLADPCVPTEDDQTTFACSAQWGQELGQLVKLELTPDQQSSLPAFGPAQSEQPMGGLWLREALQSEIAHRFQPDMVTQRQAHHVGHQHLAGERPIGQPCGEVHRLAGHGIAALQITAGDDLASGDPAMDG